MRVEQVDWAGVGARIKNARRQRGFSQRELGDPIASPSLISLVESGARRPSARLLDHVAARLTISADELLTGRSPHEDVAVELRLQEAREHLRLGEVDAAAEVGDEVVRRAAELSLARLEARGLEFLASLEERTNAFESALELYRRAEILWTREPPHLAFQTIAGIARCHQALGNPRLAVHVLETYLLTLEREGVPDPRATMRANAALVTSYSALGLTTKAAEAAERAQALAPHVTDAEQLACMNMNVARSLFDQGRMTDALDAIRSAERAYLSLGWEVDAARAKLNRAIVQMDKGELDAARENLVEAVATLKTFDTLSEAARAMNELARVERRMGNTDAAIDLLREAKDLLADAELSERALNLRELGLCVQERDADAAKSHLRQAIDLYMLAGAGNEVATTYKVLGDLHRRAGEVAESAEAYRAGIEAIETRPV